MESKIFCHVKIMGGVSTFRIREMEGKKLKLHIADFRKRHLSDINSLTTRVSAKEYKKETDIKIFTQLTTKN